MYEAPFYLPCRVLRVIDGDTFDCEIILAGRAFGNIRTTERVRLAHVDTWEVRGEQREMGLRATQAVVEWIGDGYPMWIATDGQREWDRGKYGRLVADLVKETKESLADFLSGSEHEKQ